MHASHASSVLSLHAWISRLRASQRALSFHWAQFIGYAPELCSAAAAGIVITMVATVAAIRPASSTERQDFIGVPSRRVQGKATHTSPLSRPANQRENRPQPTPALSDQIDAGQISADSRCSAGTPASGRGCLPSDRLRSTRAGSSRVHLRSRRGPGREQRWLESFQGGICGGGLRRVFRLHGLQNPQPGREARGALATQQQARRAWSCPRNCAADSRRTTAHGTRAPRSRRAIACPGVPRRSLMYLTAAPTVR